MTPEEQYQKGMELWETAKRQEHDMIRSSEARRQMIVCQKQAAEQGYAEAQHQLGEKLDHPDAKIWMDAHKYEKSRNYF